MAYQFDFTVIMANWRYLAMGIVITALVTCSALACSLPIAGLLATCRLSRFRGLRLLATAYVTLFRNTPTLVQLIWVYYCLPILAGVDIPAIQACILALTLSAGAYLGEILRGGIKSIDAGQFEAARTVGLSPFQTMRTVIFPQALRRVLAPTVNEIVTLVKFSSLVSVLGVADLTYQAQVLSSTTFRPIEIFTVLGLEYLMICTVISALAQRLERRLSVSGAR